MAQFFFFSFRSVMRNSRSFAFCKTGFAHSQRRGFAFWCVPRWGPPLPSGGVGGSDGGASRCVCACSPRRGGGWGHPSIPRTHGPGEHREKRPPRRAGSFSPLRDGSGRSSGRSPARAASGALRAPPPPDPPSAPFPARTAPPPLPCRAPDAPAHGSPARSLLDSVEGRWRPPHRHMASHRPLIPASAPRRGGNVAMGSG